MLLKQACWAHHVRGRRGRWGWRRRRAGRWRGRRRQAPQLLLASCVAASRSPAHTHQHKHLCRASRWAHAEQCPEVGLMDGLAGSK